ncbi:MAG TPA: nucleotidyltransferase family protein [Terracidiphilus sp.]|jgi:NDP-sugar pyrophosphorylase family protein|nr:nucleotidyltransferase family protein [Terracidiphilus sp.]
MSEETQGDLPPALILCGGLGTRLRAAYDGGPKALAPVAGRPFLDFQLAWLRRQGVRGAVLCVGYKHALIEALYPAGAGDPVIRYSVEDSPLGTAGAVKNAEAAIGGERFFVVNGDSLADVSLASLLAFHREREAAATIATVDVDDAARYGSVAMDGEGRVTGFAEKGAASGPGRVNAGVYVMERAVLEIIPAGRAYSLEREVFPALIGPALHGKGLYGFSTNGSFIDIGVPEDLLGAQKVIPERFNS